ncbi:hypothetical protein JCM5353_004182 [Sporobolomyces roseus]
MEYFTPLSGSSAPDFSSSTLLLPQPSLASLAQLASDLIIHNFSLQRIGFLGLRDHIPAVSGSDGLPGQSSGGEGVSFSVEVFQTPSKSLTVVLPRSPVIRARRPHYLDSMRKFIEVAGFKEVLIVASIDAALRGDEGLNSSTPLRYFLLPSASPTSLPLSTVSSPYSTSTMTSESSSKPSIPIMPHSGLTRKLLESLSESSSSMPPISTILIYTFETSETETAFYLADALSTVLKKELEELESSVERLSLEEAGEGQASRGIKWKTPRSWETGLLGAGIGRETGTEMFG